MQLGNWLRAIPQMWRIRKLFDAGFYLARYPDVHKAGMNPLFHYVQHGAAEGRKPNRLFEPDYYLSCCPAARHSGNPLQHFLDTEGRFGNPHPLFDCAAYLADHPAAGNPLLHYLAKQRAAALAVGGWPVEGPLPPPPPVAPVSIEILDVRVDVAFWEDASGRMNFESEAQQRSFFHAMRYDQLVAQLKPPVKA
jgi:hypothetical protein